MPYIDFKHIAKIARTKCTAIITNQDIFPSNATYILTNCFPTKKNDCPIYIKDIDTSEPVANVVRLLESKIKTWHNNS